MLFTLLQLCNEQSINKLCRDRTMLNEIVNDFNTHKKSATILLPAILD